jgi:dTDP-4-dehydrorhamnose reductase
MRVLVTGAAGQVGQAVIRRAPGAAIVLGVTRDECDIADAVAVGACIRGFSPDVVVNAAAYTAVDKAESEPALAERVNAHGVRVLAEATRAADARLLHVSTDFIFDGKASAPYRTDSLPAPLNVYGATKLAGELEARSVSGLPLAILRTAWVYAASGRNFLTTMLHMMRERERVQIVTDQVGTPTAADSVADALWTLAARPELTGTYHWTDAGVASWYDFAVAIADEAAATGLLSRDVQVEPIAAHRFPTAALRPAYSVLDKESTASMLGLTGIHWRRRLREVIRGMSDE